MKITASIFNGPSGHEVTVATNGSVTRLAIAPKRAARGSSVNGGELLLAALATCYCNDVFREAARKGIVVTTVEVEAEAEFDAVGAPATSVRYRARITGPGDPAELEELGRHTDSVAEIQETVRRAVPVVLDAVEVAPADGAPPPRTRRTPPERGDPRGLTRASFPLPNPIARSKLPM